ncbi:hypothetical protein TWF106_006314 [Orbilia oligospora]|uniref:Uncharacterized protein n=1 Tax=Orbilia oligospora TaxID=2813651 RepID=A0A7C8R3E6_ORBOL|nr:hypothetical protein TWF106_006314 [Orbilia oligospora]
MSSFPGPHPPIPTATSYDPSTTTASQVWAQEPLTTTGTEIFAQPGYEFSGEVFQGNQRDYTPCYGTLSVENKPEPITPTGNFRIDSPAQLLQPGQVFLMGGQRAEIISQTPGLNAPVLLSGIHMVDCNEVSSVPLAVNETPLLIASTTQYYAYRVKVI